MDHYLKISDIGDPKYWEMDSIDYVLAFESIQQTAVEAFDRGQRTQLANRILHILLLANVRTLARFIDHLVLLCKFLMNPNKSMDIFGHTNQIVNKKRLQESQETTLVRLARRIDGVAQWSNDNVNSVITLKRLTQSVVGYD